MKQPEKSDDPRRELRLNGKKKNNSSLIRAIKDKPPIQKHREQIEPEGEQARLRRAKGK